MAAALAGGFLKSGLVTADDIIATDVSAEARQRFELATGAAIAESNGELVANSDVVFLAIKPQHAGPVLAEVRESVTVAHLVISIVAGLSRAAIADILGDHCRIIRVMPNTPCLIGAGASAFSPGPAATAEDADLAQRLLATLGVAIAVDEPLLDAVTGLSGSGPAYGFQMIEALSDGGVRMGLPRAIATQLAAQTMLGAAKMVLETGEHPGALKDAVASPGGTTIAGLHALEQGGLRAAIINAVQAATERSAELGRLSSSDSSR